MIIAGIYNYKHRLINTHIVYKALFTAILLIAVLIKDSLIYNCCVFPVMFVLIRYTTKIKTWSVIKLFSIPILFLIFSCITIAIDINTDRSSFIVINKEGTFLATEVFIRSITIISIVFFWMLTNTISEISNLLRYMKVHPLFVDLFVLTYRFIIILSNITVTMFTAQKCRIAYTKNSNRYKALSYLFSRVFNRSLQVADITYKSMDSRLYNSKILYLRKDCNHKKSIPALLYIPLLIFITIYISLLYV